MKRNSAWEEADKNGITFAEPYANGLIEEAIPSGAIGDVVVDGVSKRLCRRARRTVLSCTKKQSVGDSVTDLGVDIGNVTLFIDLRGRDPKLKINVEQKS